jgi:cytoskeleton protein RodZ
MSKNTVETVERPPVELPGSLLRQAREEKGLTIEEMSAISNLTKQVIRGIESDDYADLAGLSFVRGYLKLYAKKLGVDESKVLDPFDLWKAVQSGEQPSSLANVSQNSEEITPGPSKKSLVAVSAVVVILLVSGIVISYMDANKQQVARSNAAAVNEITDSAVVTSSAKDETAQEQANAPSNEGEPTLASNSADEGTPAGEGEIQQEAGVSSEEDVAPKATDTIELAKVEPVTVTQPRSEPVKKQEPKPVEPEPVAQETRPKPIEPQTTRETVEEQVVEEPVVVSTANLNQGGRVIAEASGLSPAPTAPVQTTQVSPGEDDGLRVLSETVTGPSADQLAMGARGRLEIVFTGESWVEIRDARGRLVMADLMTPENGVELDTFGPIEVLVGAVSVSTLSFNGETQDLKSKAYQDVARITLGAETP